MVACMLRLDQQLALAQTRRHEIPHHCSGAPVSSPNDVGIDAERGVRRGVAEALGHRADVHAVGNERRRHEVAEIVQADAIKPARSRRRPKRWVTASGRHGSLPSAKFENTKAVVARVVSHASARSSIAVPCSASAATVSESSDRERWELAVLPRSRSTGPLRPSAIERLMVSSPASRVRSVHRSPHSSPRRAPVTAASRTYSRNSGSSSAATVSRRATPSCSGATMRPREPSAARHGRPGC